jgi:hypothetical protein
VQQRDGVSTRHTHHQHGTRTDGASGAAVVRSHHLAPAACELAMLLRHTPPVRRCGHGGGPHGLLCVRPGCH